MALRLRRESIRTLKWIVQRLPMGSWTNVANSLARGKNKSKSVKVCGPFTFKKFALNRDAGWFRKT